MLQPSAPGTSALPRMLPERKILKGDLPSVMYDQVL